MNGSPWLGFDRDAIDKSQPVALQGSDGHETRCTTHLSATVLVAADAHKNVIEKAYPSLRVSKCRTLR